MWLRLVHPEVPTCTDCQAWLHNKDWSKTLRAGQPVPRTGGPTPCWACPKGKLLFPPQPYPAADLSAKNEMAWQFYHQVRAGQPMPDDPVTVRNCGLIRMVEDQVERAERSLGPLLSVLFARKSQGNARG